MLQLPGGVLSHFELPNLAEDDEATHAVEFEWETPTRRFCEHFAGEVDDVIAR
jgi:hypothetical protein